MVAIQQLESELSRLAQSTPAANSVLNLSSGSSGTQLVLDFESVDSMSCALNEIRLSSPHLGGIDFDQLTDWANVLCNQVTYLLEQMGPLELDPTANQVLVRSTPPGKDGDETQYYEVVLQAQADGSLCLKRYLTRSGTAGKEQVAFHLTHQVLKKLVQDIVDTLP